MNTNRDFDRLASSWLATGPTELNDRVLEAALAEVHLTDQRRRSSAPWRTFTLTNPQRLAAAVAIVAIAGVAGLNLLPRNSVGAPTVAPTASSTAAPTSSPVPSPSTAPTSASRDFPHVAGPVAAGDYRAGAPFVLPDLAFVAPTGWNAWGAGVTAHVLSMEIDSATKPDNTAAFVNFEVPLGVYADPCRSGRTVTVPDLGPTVGDFVTALSNLPKFTMGPVSDVLVDGLPGKQFDFANAVPDSRTGCPGADPLIHVWNTGDVGGDTLAGVREHLIVLDVRGTRLVIEILYTDPDMPTQHDIDAIISSVRFE